MKDLWEQKKFLLIGGGVILVLLVLGLISLGGSGLISNQTEDGELATIEAQKNGSSEKLIIHSDGRVEVHKDGQIFSGFWARGKTSALFAYYNDFYAEGAEVLNGKATFTYDEDELIGAIVDETTSGGSGGSGGNSGAGPGQDIDDLFNTPAPAPTGSGGSAGTGTLTPTPTPVSGTPWCLYWRLSYCVIAYQTPVPSGASPTPAANILPPTCPENTLTGRTVIGNELCFSSPLPSPTP